MRSVAASAYSALYGNPGMFTPLWHFRFWVPYIYNLSPLKATLGRYIDF
jgi:hypothetical protein